MTEEEAIEQFKDLSTDEEVAHGEADGILLSYLTSIGHTGIVKAWRDARERIGFWYA